MNKTLLALLVSACVVTGAQSQMPSNFFLTRLDNGLEVLVIEDKTVPLITVEITVKNGSYTESPEYNGLSHLYEHMFFKANKDIPDQEAFLNRTNELGMQWNGSTSNERVNYYFTLNKKFLKEGLEFMNSAIRYPLFDEKEMKNENPVVDGEFQRAESQPTFWLINDVDKKLWGEHFSRKNVIGNHDVILTATTEKMKVIQGKYYHPNNSILVVAGDADHNEVFKLAASIYGSWARSGFDPFEKYPIPEFKPLTKSETIFTENPNARNVIMYRAWHGPDTRNDLKATYAADVFSYILGLKSSKFQQALVESGLAFYGQVSYQTCRHVGPISIFLVPNPAKVKEAMAELDKQIAQWTSDDYFTDDQLETAKTQLAISDARSREKTSAYVHTLTFWWASASIDYYVNYVDNLKKVTRQDIKDYVNRYVANKPSVTGILTTKEGRPALEASLSK
jgi:zinc protease